jgi:copper chaperone CopZ
VLPTSTLNCKTLALKVRIHCEGCKKKVKKVLHSMEGKDGEETLFHTFK